MSKNKNLNSAKKAKNDEFYTRLEDIENELKHYTNHFKNKTVYCNCDDENSNFYSYFKTNFTQLGLKRLIVTSYRETGEAYKLEINKDNTSHPITERSELQNNGDFRSPECIELLKESDIVVTNPPFSLFREYVKQLFTYNKKFLIIGNMNAITYKEIFSLIKENKLWLGYTSPKEFEVPMKEPYISMKGTYQKNNKLYKKFGNITWYTNLKIDKRNEELILYRTYNPVDYPKYDNYDAIEVSKVVDVPKDYDGVMGVPITFLDKYNPEQFEILGSNRGRNQDNTGYYGRSSFIDGKETFKRIFIKKRK